MIQLVPFNPPAPNLRLSGDFQIKGQQLEIIYELADPTNLILEGPTKGEWSEKTLLRADNLWKKTCFEAFWSLPDEKSYWEFNVSCKGEWNLYFFEDYRSPQPPVASSDFQLTKVSSSGRQLKCELTTSLTLSALEASLCAVLRTQNPEPFYYATRHSGEKPDFHLRQSLSLKRGKR